MQIFRLFSPSPEQIGISAFESDHDFTGGGQTDQQPVYFRLAQGGMADIYRAYDLVNRRDVVLKIPDKMMIGDPAQYERFQRELEVLARVAELGIQLIRFSDLSA